MPTSDSYLSRPRLIRDASFLEADRREIALRRGRISTREVYGQVNACSCLTLILAGIVYWQARGISRIGAAPDFPFNPDLLRHASSIEKTPLRASWGEFFTAKGGRRAKSRVSGDMVRAVSRSGVRPHQERAAVDREATKQRLGICLERK